ncbi:PD-(D/E)XK nuclease family protein [Robertmurraya siralis]|uniref:PD-(D/E)XK nuclease family protein n=1 Tax=Robertmurraya siralis TaxID=77777 RepID=UPI0010F7BD9D|nr:PD-(D/E)XK nuclease family protein [Robertmurraya siralis]
MNAQEKLSELKEKGIPVYSFSRLGSFYNCEYEYFNTYVEQKKGIENVYTLIGSEIHDNMEKFYGGEGDRESFKNNYENKLIELEMLGVKFPNDKIGDSYKSDVRHFISNFTPIEKKMIQEQLIVFEIADGIWMQGYIDSIIPSDKGKPFVDVIDWKTSSKFSGKKLDEAGKQLLMYKVGLESTTPYKVDKVMWCMVKYVNVCWKQKNGKIKEKMSNRSKWVKEIRKQLEKDMYSLQLEDFEIELLLDQAIDENNLDCLPKVVQEKYWLEDCFVEYEITNEKVDEFKKYVIETVQEIESKDRKNEDEWKSIELNKYNSFYCSTLCGHRKSCKFYKNFLEENADGFTKKEQRDGFNLENLFG